MFVKIVEESAVNWCLRRVLWPSGKTSTGELHNREERDNFLDQIVDGIDWNSEM